MLFWWWLGRRRIEVDVDRTNQAERQMRDRCGEQVLGNQEQLGMGGSDQLLYLSTASPPALLSIRPSRSAVSVKSLVRAVLQWSPPTCTSQNVGVPAPWPAARDCAWFSVQLFTFSYSSFGRQISRWRR